jgi:hypothetical protein
MGRKEVRKGPREKGPIYYSKIRIAFALDWFGFSDYVWGFLKMPIQYLSRVKIFMLYANSTILLLKTKAARKRIGSTTRKAEKEKLRLQTREQEAAKLSRSPSHWSSL